MGHSVFFWKMLEYRLEYSKKPKDKAAPWFCKVCIPTITITHLQYVRGNKLDMSWFGECSGFNRQDTYSSVMHKPQKNTHRVGAIAFNSYATKIRKKPKIDTTQSKPPRKNQKTLDQYNEMHVNHLGIYQANI